MHGTYLGNIYGIYQDCIRSIHRYLWEKVIRNTDPMGRPPKAAAPLGRRRRRRLCFWWFSLIDIYGYSLYSPDIFHICFLDMFHCHPCIFPCVFLNLWSQEEVRTCPNSDLWSEEEVRTWRKSEFWSNLTRFGSKNSFLTKWPNDSASFLPEKLKTQVILTPNLNIWPQIPTILKKYHILFA